MPYLTKLGVTPERLIYKFDFKDVRFIFLWSGKYDYRSPSLWDGDRPKYAEQMQQLRQWLDEAKAQGIPKTFITFHYPVFCRAGLGPTPEPDNPHKVIASYAKDMEVVVFNGHVHTTEMYDVDGVRFWCWAVVGQNRTLSCRVVRASRCPQIIRRTFIGRANRPRRITTTSSWMSYPARRQSSHSVASVPGRLSRSPLWSYSRRPAERFR